MKAGPDMRDYVHDNMQEDVPKPLIDVKTKAQVPSRVLKGKRQKSR